MVTLNFTQYEVGELERYLDKLKEYIKKDEPKKHDRFDDRKYDIERINLLKGRLKGNYQDLKDVVKYIAKKLDIKGYAKLDFRVKNGKYYLIEVNSQVSFHPEGEFITCAKTDGYSFEQIINRIVKQALMNETKENSIGIGATND